MSVLIVGASSFIGFNFYQHYKQASNSSIFGTYHKHQKDSLFYPLDITDRNQIFSTIERLRPETIVWVAGSKNLVECENDFDFSTTINTQPVKNALDVLQSLKLNSHFVFLSTDYVFDGIKGCYKDTDIPNPKTNYGKSNYLAEELILDSAIRSTIVRTSAVMGKGGTFFDWVVSDLQKNNAIELFADSIFSPTPIALLCEVLQNIIQNKILGTVHVCGEQRFSRFSFVQELKKMDSRFVAPLIDICSNKNQLFQPDLSLIPSTITTNTQEKSLFEYLRFELQ